MAIYKNRTFGCPECEGEFTVFMADGEAYPRHCLLCGAYVGADPEPIPYFSRVGKATDGSHDKIYRAMEDASIGRAEQAAEMMGTSVAEQSNIKITNMSDSRKEGDVSYMAPAPTPIQSFGQTPSNIAAMGGAQGLATANMIKQGGGSVGHKVMDGFKQSHHQRAASMQRNGQMGSFSGK